MTCPRRPARLTAWIAMFAILLAALAPSLARALAPAQQALPWNDICTTLGMPSGAGDAVPASAPGQHEGADFKHCPFCLHPAGQFVLPSQGGSFLPAGAIGTEPRPRAFVAPPPRLIQPAARPRAPPAIS